MLASLSADYFTIPDDETTNCVVDQIKCFYLKMRECRPS